MASEANRGRIMQASCRNPGASASERFAGSDFGKVVRGKKIEGGSDEFAFICKLYLATRLPSTKSGKELEKDSR